jgi:hypothetical protein
MQFLSYSWERNLAIWEELYFTSRFLSQLYVRNCILHQGFSPSYMRGLVFYIKASRPAIWEGWARSLDVKYNSSHIAGEKPWCKIQFLSYSWPRSLDVKYNSSHIAGRYMRGIVFYIKVSRPAILEELYFTLRLLFHLYEMNCILHQGYSPSYMRGIVLIQFLSYSWARNFDVKYNSPHIAGRETLR